MQGDGHKAIVLLGVREPYLEALGTACERAGLHAVQIGGDGEASAAPARALDELKPILCVVRLRGRNEAGLAAVESAIKAFDARVVVLARDISIEMVKVLMRMPGVADIVEFPDEPSDIATRVLATADRIGDGPGGAMEQIVGDTEPAREMRQALVAAARVPSTVLLQGETGTGKGLAARAIHQASDRSALPFVHVDCAALSPTLIESELFGHEKGAFTSAGAQRKGRFEQAGAGTIFLDEIGDLNLDLQTKLLRVLEDRKFERVGGNQEILMAARVIAATSHDLRKALGEGTFRADLYYRLNVLRIPVPSLRERPGDIPALMRSMLDRLSRTMGVPAPAASESFYERLTGYSWPGNIRELKNVAERLLVSQSATRLEAEDLEDLLERTGRGGRKGLRAQVEHTEAEQIAAMLRDTGGNVALASRRLEMARGTLRDRIRRYGLEHLAQKPS